MWTIRNTYPKKEPKTIVKKNQNLWKWFIKRQTTPKCRVSNPPL